MSSKEQTPYQIFDVSEDIGYVTLRCEYRTKIHEHLQKKISAIRFRRICRAYETLSDFDKRKHFDNDKEWTVDIPIDRYTPQQLAAEPDLIRELKKRLEKANLTEINAKDPITGHTTLYCAARAGNIEAVKFLTEHGAEPDLSQRTKSTALHVASFYGHANVVRCLLESGADYRITNSGERTAEGEAFDHDVKNVFTELKQNDYVRVAANELEWFQKNGLKQHQDTEYFSQRQTLLHCASKKGYFDMVRWFVEQYSANIDLIDFNGNSALHLAAYGGHTDIVEYLLNRGCDSTLTNRWGTTAEEEGIKHGSKITNLFKTIRQNDMFEMAKTGIDWWFYYYFDKESKDMIDTDGISLLYYACSYGHFSVAKWLLEHGANINIQMKRKPRSTPLHVAKYRGHLSIVELLLEYGADVNIKNDYDTTVFEEVVCDGVDVSIIAQIKQLLEQYKSNLKTEKLLDVHIYDDDGNGQEPIVKLKLGIEANYNDLIKGLSDLSGNQYPYFSVARRLLRFNNDSTIISAVCCARYASSKFLDTPIRLIRHKTLPDVCKNHQSTHEQSKLNLRSFDKQLSNLGQVTYLKLTTPLTQTRNLNVGNLRFTFSENSITDNIEIKVTTLFSPDRQIFNVPGCICLFKTELFEYTSKLIQRPVVSIEGDPQARLYTLAASVPYWFTSKTRKTTQPMMTGIHAFVHHVDIIPGQLSLPADMFLATTLQRPLETRNNPVPCTCLTLREQDTKAFPHKAYHGTNIKVIQSILLDGLVIPGTVVSSGIRVTPPTNHFARENTYFNVPQFADAIFLSPSIHYSSDPTYAATFSDGDRQLIPVLECSVKSDSYKTYPSTVGRYNAHPGDNMNAIEWRVNDPANVQINAVLFIVKIDSIIESKRERITLTT